MRLSRNIFVVCLYQLTVLTIVFIASMSAQRITTTAGGFAGDGGAATNAGMTYPRYAIQDQSGNLFISDSFNHRIRKVTSVGVISTVAGTGIAGFSGDGGLAKNAML